MFKLRAAKKRLSYKYCNPNQAKIYIRQKKNCALAKEMDKKRDIENAEILANEQEIKDLISSLKKQLKQQIAEVKKAQQQAQNDEPQASFKHNFLTKHTPRAKVIILSDFTNAAV